ncbi:hypothetical protein BS78_05G201200 [Paspalum vaginatum]|nr:hypothetical protein BS78_05G201200 [Paspalum vaginatum]
MKKADELTKLCGIKACVVVYDEVESKGEAKPEVCPSIGEVKQLIIKFKEMPEVGSFKKIQNQETFLDSRCSKLREQVHKLGHGNREDETLILLHDKMDGCHLGLTGMAEEKLVSVRKNVEMKMCKTKALLQQIIGQEALSEPPLVQPKASSSSQTQVSPNNCTGMQRMAPPEEYQHLEHDWQLTDLVMNGGDLDTVFWSAMAGSSNDPSSSGCDVMRP